MKSFFALIDRLNGSEPVDRSAAEELIWSTFGVQKAVMALDMSQFSLSVRRSGILRYLGQIRRMQLVTRPLVREWHGEVVKYQADNLMAVFPDAADAVGAAVEINRGLTAVHEELVVGIGIDYGTFLMIPGKDCFGDAVNVAYKLGEDLARPGEILITAAARERLDGGFRYALLEQRVSVSGLELAAYAVAYE